MSNYLGEKIKFYRKEKKLTQKSLGELINKSHEAIRKYETGERQPPIKVIQQISDALEVPMNEFISDENSIWTNTNFNAVIEEAKAFEGIDNIAKYFNLPLNFHSMDEEEAYNLLNNIGSYLDFLLYKKSK